MGLDGDVHQHRDASGTHVSRSHLLGAHTSNPHASVHEHEHEHVGAAAQRDDQRAWPIGHAHGHDHSAASRRRLIIALVIVVVVAVAEFVGAALTGSLALLGDAGHMLSDGLGLGIALVALLIAARPATDRLTWGFRRAEVLGALANGVLLSGVAVFIAIEGIRRLVLPEQVEVLAGPMLVVATIGLFANLAALFVLRGGKDHSINLRAAYLEVIGDLLGSVAAIVAAVVIALTGFEQADALASLAIAAMILPRAFVLLRDVLRVLTEATPHGTSIDEIRAHLLSFTGVVDVHDVHVWSITAGQPVFSAHVVVEASVFEEGHTAELLARLVDCLRDHFDVDHSTIQLEPTEHAARERPSHA